MLTEADLPDDIDALKALVIASKAHGARQDERIAELEKLVKAFKQALFGSKSEKVDPDQFQLALEDLETAIAVVHAADEAAPSPIERKRKKCRSANRGALPKHLPRIEEVIEPDNLVCSCGGELHCIGEDVTERHDVIPAQFRVIVTRRPKYACRFCTDGVAQAKAPARLIEGGMPTEDLVAHIVVRKYADHLPLYRQAQIYSRQGIDLDRSTLGDWVGRAAFELRPVFDALVTDLKQSGKLFMDEPRAPVLDPGKRKTKTGYFWALARDDRSWDGNGPPGVAFTYAPGRSGKYAEQILQGFSGILQVDGYAGYNRLLKRASQDIRLAYYWAHARRKLVEITRTGNAPIAQEGINRIVKLYGIEKEIKGMDADDRRTVRQGKSAPLIAELEIWVEQRRARVSAKSPLGEALAYVAKFWDGLCLFLTEGRIEMDNNSVERTIRPIALNRKNALLAGHDAGATNWATIASLIETCKLNDVDPHTWMTSTLKAIVNGHKQSDIDELLPWNFLRNV
ncbi:Transposase [Cohaesibacter sp. ES.047]|uniref:IS66 family transposase n=1 Tax=Cohaesibacter sp. ES.047 TaxID=1798205 RepID=UPI000BB9A87B|nr:IS66 family transposase [Cohaesibacter sp. ES.047]SNY92284.1 Transposase [Cohaesibacter sp. ES.047]